MTKNWIESKTNDTEFKTRTKTVRDIKWRSSKRMIWKSNDHELNRNPDNEIRMAYLYESIHLECMAEKDWKCCCHSRRWWRRYRWWQNGNVDNDDWMVVKIMMMIMMRDCDNLWWMRVLPDFISITQSKT